MLFHEQIDKGYQSQAQACRHAQFTSLHILQIVLQMGNIIWCLQSSVGYHDFALHAKELGAMHD